MTTILGVQHRNGFTLAADSQTTNNDRPYMHSDLAKITKAGHLWIAGAGSARVCDIVQNTWQPPVFTKTDTAYKYMIAKAVPPVALTSSIMPILVPTPMSVLPLISSVPLAYSYSYD